MTLICGWNLNSWVEGKKSVRGFLWGQIQVKAMRPIREGRNVVGKNGFAFVDVDRRGEEVEIVGKVAVIGDGGRRTDGIDVKQRG